MLKHATISRTSRAQQTLQLQRHWKQQDQQQLGCNQVRDNITPTPTQTQTTTTSSPTKSCKSSMIKIFAQTLSQDVEYITLHVNTQTKSQQIIKTLLRKFRLKHRDPNLFHLTLERWIRKDGLKFKSVMLLGDEACPLQLQQCCSNPPHNDIKFTLQMRSGALIKIHCSDVVPDAKYKCLSLSTQTTVEETIELMLYCLNLASQTNSNSNSTKQSSDHQDRHFSSSPNSSHSASSSSSSSSDTSSSSGIDSEPGNNKTESTTTTTTTTRKLNSDSRASSVTSISSSSNVSSLSSGLIDQYCLLIECKDSNFKRVLHPDEYLVDVYQSLLAEAAAHHHNHLASNALLSSPTNQDSDSLMTNHHLLASTKPFQPPTNLLNATTINDQWFFIKLKRRYESTAANNNTSAAINYVNPRQNVPLPPIPASLFNQQQQQQANNNNRLRHIVSTTEIEVNRPARSLASLQNDSSRLMRQIMGSTPITLASHSPQHLATATTNPLPPTAASAMDELDSASGIAETHHRPPIILLTPPVRPRRRNLSNVSSTFGRPLIVNNNNRRRYDPAQLVEDLDQLNIAGGCALVAPVAGEPG